MRHWKIRLQNALHGAPMRGVAGAFAAGGGCAGASVDAMLTAPFQRQIRSWRATGSGVNA
jgi:hypothetical protein